MGQFRDLTGERFGRLVVLQRDGHNKHRQLLWLCKCDCGNTKTVLGFLLSRGESSSCGCLKKESIAKVNYRHGMTKTPIYGLWHAMIQRCYDKNCHAYSRYGGRGIIVCDKWQTFEGFYEDMGDRPQGKSLERLDNNGNYSRENVIWADIKQQNNNRRTNVVLEHNGKKQTMQQWCDELNLKFGTVWARLNRGWDVSRALTQKVRYAQ